MVELRSVSKEVTGLESVELPPMAPPVTRGHVGSATAEVSRSVRHLVGTGKSGPISSGLETVLGVDDRVRILDTDLTPWRMICALRMRGPTGAGAIGTGWFVGPRTLLTAGHCVFSSHFFGGWASTIEVIPGMNGDGDTPATRPYGNVTSPRLSSVDRWTEKQDPDFDIGCIHLDQPLGDVVGWFSVGALLPERLESFLVNVSGYPGDRGAGCEQYHARNRVLQVTDRRIFYEVDTYGGQSGAPVWIHEEDGAAPVAVAVHAYGAGGTPAGVGAAANSAPRIIPEVLDKIIEWVEEDGGWPEG